MFREEISIKKSNPLAALYPSAKGWIVVLYCICIAILTSIRVNGYALYLMAAFLIIPVLFVTSGIWEKFHKFFKSILLFLGLIFVVQTMVLKSEVVLFQFWFIKIYEAGLQHAIVLCFVIMNVAGILLWLFQTTETKEMTYALEKAGMSYKASFVFLSTFQMIEVLGKSSKTIMNAQRARGVETEGNLIVRSKAFFPMIVPLVVGSLMNTEERVLTLECKGFDTQCPKTHLLELKKTGNETKAVAIASVITAIIMGWRLLLWIL